MKTDYQVLEDILIKKHALTNCDVVDSKMGRIDVIATPQLTETEEDAIEDTVDEYFGTDWQGFALVYSTSASKYDKIVKELVESVYQFVEAKEEIKQVNKLTMDEFIDIMDETESDWDGDNAFKGLVILSKYTTNLVQAAEHDKIWSISVEEIVELGITKEDVIKLGKLNWMIEEDSLACFV